MFLFCFQYTLMTKHCRWKPVGKKTEFSMKSRSLSPCYYTRAHLLTTLKGSGISCGNRALCEADAAAAAASRQCHSTCRVLLSSSAQVAVVSALETACTLPAQTCHRQLCLRLCPKLIFGAFSLLRKRNRKRKNEVKKIWRFIIWKRRWSAGAQAAPQ